MSSGLRRLDGALVDDTPPPPAAAAPETRDAFPSRYGSVLRDVSAVAAPPDAAPPDDAAMLAARVASAFPSAHPGVGAMLSWLCEEGVASISQLKALLSSHGGGAKQLRAIGFPPSWADTLASAAEKW